MSRYPGVLLATTLLGSVLAGCNESSTPAATPPVNPSVPLVNPAIVIAPAGTPLSIPAYPVGVTDISNTTWQSCRYDAGADQYLRRTWHFAVTDASVTQYRHAAADTACSGSSSFDWYYDFDGIVDEGGSAATGWVNAAGTATAGGGAPMALDGLGALPAQPLARRSKFILQGVYFGHGPFPYPTLMEPTKLLLYVDTSATPHRLYVGSVSSTLDAQGYPLYLESTTGLTKQ